MATRTQASAASKPVGAKAPGVQRAARVRKALRRQMAIVLAWIGLRARALRGVAPPEIARAGRPEIDQHRAHVLQKRAADHSTRRNRAADHSARQNRNRPSLALRAHAASRPPAAATIGSREALQRMSRIWVCRAARAVISGRSRVWVPPRSCKDSRTQMLLFQRKFVR